MNTNRKKSVKASKGGFPLLSNLYVGTYVNIWRVNEKEAILVSSRVNVKFESHLTFTFTGGLSYIASNSYASRFYARTHVKSTRQWKSPQASLSFFRKRVGEWGGKEGCPFLTVSVTVTKGGTTISMAVSSIPFVNRWKHLKKEAKNSHSISS